MRLWQAGQAKFCAVSSRHVGASQVRSSRVMATKETGLVYAAKDRHGQVLYIGKTERRLRARVSEHYYDSTKGWASPFQRALASMSGVTWHVLEDGLSIGDQLNEREQALIASMRPKYNRRTLATFGPYHTYRTAALDHIQMQLPLSWPLPCGCSKQKCTQASEMD